jgi:signal transduction histidine kinase
MRILKCARERDQTMQRIDPSLESQSAERKRVETLVETLSGVRITGESLAEVAHDARNMVTALGLYCDLLEEPGVLETQFLHYGSELRLVAAASRRLVDKLVALDCSCGTRADSPLGKNGHSCDRESSRTLSDRIQNTGILDQLPARLIESFTGELLSNKNLLASIAGPSISLTMNAEGGALPVRLTGEDLTRVLVNLVKNSAEAMPAGGRITVGLHEFHATMDAAPWLVLTFEDNGPGIPRSSLEKIFESGHTTRGRGQSRKGGWPIAHRGLGLSITRSLLASAGGSIRASNHDAGGARFVIELPVRTQ